MHQEELQVGMVIENDYNKFVKREVLAIGKLRYFYRDTGQGCYDENSDSLCRLDYWQPVKYVWNKNTQHGVTIRIDEKVPVGEVHIQNADGEIIFKLEK